MKKFAKSSLLVSLMAGLILCSASGKALSAVQSRMDVANPHLGPSSGIGDGSQMAGGFVLTIKPEQETTSVDEPIWIDVEIHNVSAGHASVAGLNYSSLYTYKVVSAEGAIVTPLPVANYHGAPGGVYMPFFNPGQSMFARVRLDDWYSLVPGSYFVTAICSKFGDARYRPLPTLTSNKILIVVTQ